MPTQPLTAKSLRQYSSHSKQLYTDGRCRETTSVSSSVSKGYIRNGRRYQTHSSEDYYQPTGAPYAQAPMITLTQLTIRRREAMGINEWRPSRYADHRLPPRQPPLPRSSFAKGSTHPRRGNWPRRMVCIRSSHGVKHSAHIRKGY